VGNTIPDDPTVDDDAPGAAPAREPIVPRRTPGTLLIEPDEPHDPGGSGGSGAPGEPGNPAAQARPEGMLEPSARLEGLMLEPSARLEGLEPSIDPALAPTHLPPEPTRGAPATRIDDGYLRPPAPLGPGGPSRTIVDDEGRATAPELEAGALGEVLGEPREGEGAPLEGQAPKQRARGRAVVLAFATLAVLIVGGAVGLFWFVFRYVPVAHEHVPANANLVVRLELSELALFAPVKKQLLEAREDPAAKERAARLSKATGIAPTDLREAVIATVDGQAWLVLLGGRLSKGRFVDGMAEYFASEGRAGWTRKGPLLVGPTGIALGQADDGTLVIATNAALAEVALPAAQPAARLALPPRKAVTFVATREAFAGASGMSLVPGLDALRRVARADGDLSLGDKPTFDVRLSPAPGESPAALAESLRALLVAARAVLLFSDPAELSPIVAGAEVKVDGELVRIVAPWPLASIEAALSKARAARSPLE
jgi:hypothetical protein